MINAFTTYRKCTCGVVYKYWEVRRVLNSTNPIGKLVTKQKFDLRDKCRYCGKDVSGEDFIISDIGGWK